MIIPVRKEEKQIANVIVSECIRLVIHEGFYLSFKPDERFFRGMTVFPGTCAL